MRLSSRILVGCIALLGFSATAQKSNAAFTIDLQVNGGGWVTVASGADFDPAGIDFSGNAGGLFVVVDTSASSSNGATLSSLLGSTTRVTNTTSATQTLQIRISQTNFTLPAFTPLNVESGLGGSITTGTLGFTGIFQAYADRNNVLNGTSDFTNGPQNATANGQTYSTGTVDGTFDRTANPYSLTSITTLVVSGGGIVNYSNQNDVTITDDSVEIVPAPAGLVLLASAIPVLGLRRVLRRKTLAA